MSEERLVRTLQSYYGLLLAALLVTGIAYWLVGDTTMSGGKAPGEA